MRDRRKPPAHINHERWLVSYADFVTLLFAFFVVLYASAQIDKQRAVKLSDAIDSAFQQLGIFQKDNHKPGPVDPRISLPTAVNGGQDLSRWVAVARELDCTLLLDEFYSHYIYRAPPGRLPIESAARYVEDVDRDPIVVLDGLTKNWRYPGWRVTWALAPKNAVEAFASAGSFLDGGGSKLLQRAAIALLAEDHVIAETKAIHAAFRPKRDYLLSQLQRLGVRVDRAPDGTFYVWGCVEDLPPPLNDGMGFFRAALEEKVIVVPGEFFDVNPGKRRQGRTSRFKGYVRFSFGPAMGVLEKAVARLERLVALRPV